MTLERLLIIPLINGVRLAIINMYVVDCMYALETLLLVAIVTMDIGLSLPTVI